jgi:hypothetical protein
MTAITLGDIDRAVCAHFDIPPRKLLGKDQQRKYAVPRFAAFYLARLMTRNSYPKIGLHYGGRDHTTVLHGERRARDMLESDPQFILDMGRIERLISEGPRELECLRLDATIRPLSWRPPPWPPRDPYEQSTQLFLFEEA